MQKRSLSRQSVAQWLMTHRKQQKWKMLITLLQKCRLLWACETIITILSPY